MPTTQREIRYLTTEELTRLRRHAEARALQARENGTVGAVRAWALLDTLLSSGFRASEVAALQARDCLLGYGQASLVVRQCKGGKQPEVFIPQELKTHLKAFLTWKRTHGEDVSDESPVFTGQRGPLTRTGVWQVIKGLMAAVGLDPRYATHTCRHTFATHLYRASGADLEIVQEQLGHTSVKTTTIYAKVIKEDKARAADALAKAYHDSPRTGKGGARWPRRQSPSGGGVPRYSEPQSKREESEMSKAAARVEPGVKRPMRSAYLVTVVCASGTGSASPVSRGPGCGLGRSRAAGCVAA